MFIWKGKYLPFTYISKGFIKSTDHQPTDPPTHQPPTTYSPTYRPTDHQHTNPLTQLSPTQLTRFYLKDLINEEYSFYRTQTQQGRCKAILRSVVYLMNKYLYKIFLYFHEIFIFSFLQKKLLLCKRHTEDLIMFIFFNFKPNCSTPCQICHSWFYVWKFQ